ncbi:MAG: restriction endonuclease subunit S [Planctomycetes bacterium]|nr:restriction endonuclease subunit S [Planctomycetota bacterium]
MAVKKGYKQTEVGVIPVDWEVQRLGEITLRMTNGFVGPAIRHYTENSDGVLYIQGYNVKENSFNFHGVKYVTYEFHKANTKSCLRLGDMLTVQTGEVGLTTVVPENLVGANCHALIISRFDRARVYPLFVSFYLNSKPGRARMRLIETGTTMKHLNVGDMLHLMVPFPSLREQEAIAGALSDADAWIESLGQLIAKKRQIKQGAMQELLTGKRRLPGFSGKWETKRLGDLGSFLKGSGVRKNEANSGDIPCVRYGEIYTHHNDYIRRFNSSISPAVAETATRMNYGDLLFAGSGETKAEIGKCVAYAHDIEAYAGGDIVILRSINSVPVFMGYYCNTAAVAEQKTARGQGDAVVHISASALAGVQICVPEIHEQTAIATVLSDMDAEIESLESKLAKAREVKQGMMQELLTGSIRLIEN